MIGEEEVRLKFVEDTRRKTKFVSPTIEGGLWPRDENNYPASKKCTWKKTTQFKVERQQF